MREAGLEYGERSHTFNSRLAQELGKWADTQNEKSEIHDLIYRAYFVEGKNISDMDELLKIAETAGFDRTSAKEILEKRSFKLIVDEDWKKSRELGIQMPISEQVYRVIFDDLDPASAVTTLLGRAPREETD